MATAFVFYSDAKHWNISRRSSHVCCYLLIISCHLISWKKDSLSLSVTCCMWRCKIVTFGADQLWYLNIYESDISFSESYVQFRWSTFCFEVLLSFYILFYILHICFYIFMERSGQVILGQIPKCNFPLEF